MRRTLIAIALIMACAVASIPLVGRTTASADDALFFDSSLDGVWVGTVAVKTADGILWRPLLLNLDVGATDVQGVALTADSFVGPATAVEALVLFEGATKGKKLTFSLPAPGESALHPLARTENSYDFTLRFRKGALKGTMKSDVEGVTGKSKVQLLPLDGDLPLRQVWIGNLESDDPGAAESDTPMALFLGGDDPLTGAGFMGAHAGLLTGVEGVDGTYDLTLAAAAGDIELNLALGTGGFSGTAVGPATGNVAATAGGIGKPAKVRKATPGELPAGRSTETTLRGKNLPDGIMLHVDHPDAWAEPPTVSKGRVASVRIIVAGDVPAGTELKLMLLLPDGSTLDLKKPLVAGVGGGISLALDLQPIFTNRCALSGCHVEPDLDDPAYGGDDKAAGDLILERNRSYGNLVNEVSRGMPPLLRVEPGNPDDSYLIRKLRGENIGVTSRMPLGGPYLSDATIQMFVDWILAGAERN